MIFSSHSFLRLFRYTICFVIFAPLSSYADSFSGENLSWVWCVPFAGILLSLAFFPLIASNFWHHHYGKIIGFWTGCFLLPFWYFFKSKTILHLLGHAFFLDYLPFILMIGSLFAITGGIRLKTRWKGTPLGNVCMLLLGTIIASWIGTTGASMLLIRPLLQANRWRQHVGHIFVFFIFLVSNIGGALTPLGDPPLFLGFLQGIPFFWFLSALYESVIFLSLALLALFWGIDVYYYQKENKIDLDLPPNPLSIEGKRNIFYLIGVVIAVLISGYWRSGISFSAIGNSFALENIVRDVLLIFFGAASLYSTKRKIRSENHFSWIPLWEVSKIFLGIFITIIPVLAILQAGSKGQFGNIVSSINSQNNPESYFWISGLFSSLLDNAPTYLVFFFMAGGDVASLTGPMAKILTAISQGCVFMGAMTYIGNAPNFMVKSIAQHAGIKMPGFFKYMAWSCGILLPLFFLMIYFMRS